jgi:cysteinyl-tRNA synthetase
VCQDVLRRVLEAAGVRVRLVMGMTDVDDKILARAAERGVPWRQVAQTYESRFLEDMAALGVRRPLAPHTDEGARLTHPLYVVVVGAGRFRCYRRQR